MKTKAASVLLLTLFLAGCVPVKKEITENSQQETVATEPKENQNTVLENNKDGRTKLEEEMWYQLMGVSGGEEILPADQADQEQLEKVYDLVYRIGKHYIRFDYAAYKKRVEEEKPNSYDSSHEMKRFYSEDMSVYLPDLEPSLDIGSDKISSSEQLKNYLDEGYAVNKDKTFVSKYNKHATERTNTLLILEKNGKQAGVIVSYFPQYVGTETPPYHIYIVLEGEG